MEFNDRRIGKKPHGKGSQYNPEDGYEHWPKGSYGHGPYGSDGTKVPSKPKNPKNPMPARAVAIEHEVKGY
jgi:hypothetical protein